MKPRLLPTLVTLLTFCCLNSAWSWNQFLDGSTLPADPWLEFKDGPEEGRGETEIVEFRDPSTGETNQALRIFSGVGATEWYVGPLFAQEIVAAARFRLAAFSPAGKENLLCVQVGGPGSHAPAPSITLVNGRFKLWSYTDGTFGDPNSGSEIQDLGLATTNDFHAAYLYGHQDGMVKLWWDGKLVYDGTPPSLGGYDGFMEWGSGSWQFNASTTIDFDWVGWGNPADLPQHLASTPAHGAIFHDPISGLKFSIISQEALAPGVASEGVKIRVNGVDRTSDVTFSGTNTNRQGTLQGLRSNQVYQVRLEATDLAGTMANYQVDFDTFAPSQFGFEAEDWNFDGGQFLDNVVLAAAPGPENYLDRVGIEDIDQNELSTEAAGAPHQYRVDSTFVGTEKTRDTLRPNFIEAQATDPVITDFNVTAVQVGEWLNYTRTFPAGNYNIYGRLAYGEDGASFEAAVDKVTNATSANQQLTRLGSFKGIGHHSQTFSYVPLTDAEGGLVSVSLNGAETLRVTLTRGGMNANYYMLAPAEAPPPKLQISRSADQVVISWSGTGFNLESADRITGGWTAVPNAKSPFQATPTEPARFYRLHR